MKTEIISKRNTMTMLILLLKYMLNTNFSTSYLDIASK